MSKTSGPLVRDPWAQARRIAAEWEAAGRGVDRRTQVARVREARARRADAITEARIRNAVDKAVTEALAKLSTGAPVTESAPPAPDPVTEVAPPSKPLWEMSSEEWQQHTAQHWAGRLQPRPRPMTISELIAGRYDTDEA
ncbi:hypothetical protein ACIRVK_13660 [Streptomyces sp. NPDC101152]|uniref:hypothetical protein n=1 Tax=Streptomyces sp. NPDC101152 TaxID=3366116 RepID=UPI0038205A75